MFWIFIFNEDFYSMILEYIDESRDSTILLFDNSSTLFFIWEFSINKLLSDILLIKFGIYYSFYHYLYFLYYILIDD